MESQSSDHDDAGEGKLSSGDRFPPLIPSRHSESADVDLNKRKNVDHCPAPNFDLPVNERRAFDCPPPRIGHGSSLSNSVQSSPLPIGSPETENKKPVQLVTGDWINAVHGDLKTIDEENLDDTALDDLVQDYVNFDNIHQLHPFERDAASGTPHRRSFSCDSSIDTLQFKAEKTETEGKQIQNLPPSPEVSMAGSLSMSDLQTLSRTFNQEEMKRIMSCDKLAQTAMSNPKRAKRILSNRISAARSKQRKLQYATDLEHEVNHLEGRIAILSTEVNKTEKRNTDMKNENNEMILRLEAMKQEARLKDALNDTLAAEAQHLRRAAANVDDTVLHSSCLARQLSLRLEMIKLKQQQQNQGNLS